MKKLVALFFLLASVACAQSGVLDLGKQGKLTLFLLDGWKIESTDMAGTASMTIKSEKNDDVTCTISVTRPETDRFDSKPRLKTRVEADGYPMAENSVERKAFAREFKLSMPGYGFYCNFTDPNMRPKESKPGQYRVMTLGKIRPAPEILIDIVIMADAFNNSAYNELFGAIEGMEYKPKK